MSVRSSALFVVSWAALDQPPSYTLHPPSLSDTFAAVEARLAEQWAAWRQQQPAFPPSTRQEWVNYRRFSESALRPDCFYSDDIERQARRLPERLLLHTVDYCLKPASNRDQAFNIMLDQARMQFARKGATTFIPPAAQQTYLTQNLYRRPAHHQPEISRASRLWGYMALMPAPFPFYVTPFGNFRAEQRLRQFMSTREDPKPLKNPSIISLLRQWCSAIKL